MKAALLKKWESIEVTDIEDARRPGEDEAMIRVTWAGICGSDHHVFSGQHPTARVPVVLGHEFSGYVCEIGATSEEKHGLKEGSSVVAFPLLSCGECAACRAGTHHVCTDLRIYGIHENGGFEEYVTLPISNIYEIKEVDQRLASLAEPIAVAVHILERGRMREGDRIFILGAGPIGLLVALVARAKGAQSVIIAETNPFRLQLAERLGFITVDSRKVDASKETQEVLRAGNFDVVVEAAGTADTMKLLMETVRIRGNIVLVGFPSEPIPVDIRRCIFKEITMIGSRVYTRQNFIEGLRLVESRDLRHDELAMLITHTFPLVEFSKAMMVGRKNLDCCKILIDICGEFHSGDIVSKP